MCGITGYAGFDGSARLRRMCDLLTHRGPDDAGYYTDGDAGLAMRRLSIIDIAGGHQPISNEDGSVWVVLNGEIYNYEALRTELLANGHVLATHSDTETIVHLYEQYGLDFVSRLRGMFGIALWDTKRRRLVLARDRIGEKPLYWSDEHGLVFGSEIKSVLAGLGKRSPDLQSVRDFLATGYVGGTRTFFNGIRKLAPGTMLIWESGKATERTYWTLSCNEPAVVPFATAKAELEERLHEAVGLCLKSDVEVAAFLSGGLDSSLLVALMKQHGVAVKTFSVGYGGAAAGFNELGYAAQVAKFLDTDHRELILDPQSNIELLPKIIWHYDEPHGEPTSMLVYLLCEFVRKHVKVAIGGTGGDELFYGYPRHKGFQYLRYYRALPKILRKQIIEPLVAGVPESTRGSRLAKRVHRFIQGADQTPAEAYLSWVRLTPEHVHEELLASQERPAADPAGDAFIRQWLTGTSHSTALGAAAQIDLSGYLPEYQLSYMDRMSMANSLEVRSPFCDYRLVEDVTHLPLGYRLHGLQSKYILKQIAQRYLPKNIVFRRKVGFDSPIGQWVKGELRPFLTSFLDPKQVRKSGLLEPEAVSRVVGDHLAGKKDHSLLLWSLVSLETWYRMYIEDGILELGDYGLNDIRGAEQFKTRSAMVA